MGSPGTETRLPCPYAYLLPSWHWWDVCPGSPCISSGCISGSSLKCWSCNSGSYCDHLIGKLNQSLRRYHLHLLWGHQHQFLPSRIQILMAPVLNGSCPASQVSAGMLAGQAPGQELALAQGRVVEQNICQPNRSCLGCIQWILLTLFMLLSSQV